MIFEGYLLSVVTFLPAAAALVIALLNADAKGNARWIALWTTVATFLLSLLIWVHFDAKSAGFQLVEDFAWLGPIRYKMGVDGISMLFVILTTFLMPLCILASWEAIEDRVKEYMIAFLLLETLMIGVFCALDMVLFYLFFEGGLIPMFIIIGVWGGKRRVYASFKFFLYTLLGSVLMLLAMMAIYWQTGTTDIPRLIETAKLPADLQWWLWLAFFASFAVKMPMWPVHTWLPDAHVEAPTAGSMILAGVLLKMGGYGFIRFSLPMFPDASVQLMWIVFGLSMVAVVYTSLIALVQADMKKLIAYSSVAHMAFVTGGLFAFNTQGVEGAMVVMLSHGVVSAALFFCVGVIYDRLHTRDIDRYGGVTTNMPRYAVFFLLFTMASVALPGTSGFVGEFLALTGIWKANTWVAFVMASGVILGAAYMLWLFARVMYGAQKNADAAAMPDLNAREWAILVPLAVVALWMGVYPKPFLEPLKAPVESLMARTGRAAPPQTPFTPIVANGPVQLASAAVGETK